MKIITWFDNAKNKKYGLRTQPFSFRIQDFQPGLLIIVSYIFLQLTIEKKKKNHIGFETRLTDKLEKKKINNS